MAPQFLLFESMNSLILSKIITLLFTLCLGIIVVIVGSILWFSWNSKEIFEECHKLQKYTFETDAAYSNCMKSHGLDPEDWE